MKNEPLRVLFVTTEAYPFAKTGGLADVSASLPRALLKTGVDIRVIMPLYGSIAKDGHKIKKAAGPIRHKFSGRIFGFDLLSNSDDGILTYFIKNEKYFARRGLYGTSLGDYPDNALRFGFFSKAALAAAETLKFKPHIIHCNDWQTALIPFYLNFVLNNDDFFKGIKTLFTIHNLAYQGVFGKIFTRGLGIPAKFFNADQLEFYNKLNFMKSGISYADSINTVSRKYAEEIMTPEYGCGLEGLLAARGGDLSGIPNGVDYKEWDPRNDKFIKENYSPATLDKKKACKKDLLKCIGLDFPQDRPLIGYVGRFAYQKGVDIIAGVAAHMRELNAAMVILGKGDAEYKRLLKEIARKYPENIRITQVLDEELAHKIEAGSDIFLMPSRYEPCGLNQMYSIRYGTIPVVRATGGLDDVVVDFDDDRYNGNGFKFIPIDSAACLRSVKRAIMYYENSEVWRKLMLQAMKCDFSWEHSASEYVKLYEKMTE
ncbi:MAG: glycogen synthase GlgA [Candidatus Omnitrophica bacterium]|nr:glycogen synthase GlgA [Candidatus Omnitrophota bacterium]MBU1128247.1 glycogen synthase GlgA [Candidatus Omnitrophota bacterium]MBU1784414.1 glycogen synthase GlgA [Candidatus Omnitrophota bacterium]MBU1850921.1 glycogen synthase GlgA [Candidatus Omnitrophota bacterium]